MQSNPQILIIDRDIEHLTSLISILEALSVDISAATTRDDIFALTSKGEFCLAIIVVDLPSTNSYRILELLRREKPAAKLPVILISDQPSDEIFLQNPLGPGPVDILHKPFHPKALLNKVQFYIDIYYQRLEMAAMYNHMLTFNSQLEDLVRQRTRELKEAYDVMEKLDHVKNDFIHIAAHELRTPLTLIQGYTEMLENVITSQPDAIKLVDGILHGLQRLVQVVESLTDISRINNQAFDIKVEIVNLRHLIEGVCRNYEDSLIKRQLNLLTTGLEILPEIKADPIMIHKVFTNLIGNAIKYTPDGGVIQISTREMKFNRVGLAPDNTIHIMVSDTGIGIAPENQELIFETFYQTGPIGLHSSSQTKFKGGGSGLGLSIARGIIELHGGRIWVESPGHDENSFPGSTFHILLPVNRENGPWKIPTSPLSQDILIRSDKR
jgi:signal transduction histidine kinase